MTNVKTKKVFKLLYCRSAVYVSLYNKQIMWSLRDDANEENNR